MTARGVAADAAGRCRRSAATRGVAADRRNLDWDGCFNIRDLGGRPLARGGSTPLGRVVRGDSPDRVSEQG